MTKTFVTSDIHFGHFNIIGFCSRPFVNTAEMNNSIIERWNTRVDEGDTVYFLGDFAMGQGVDENFILGILAQLNGTIKVVLGNHDQPLKKFKAKGLKRIVEDNNLDIEVLPDIFELKYDGQQFVFCHFPMSDWNGRYHGSVHLHGHCHSMLRPHAPKEIRAGLECTQHSNGRWYEHNIGIIDNRYDIGVDMFGGPVRLTGDCRYIKDPTGWDK